MADNPFSAASDLIRRVGDLALEAKRIRAQLDALRPAAGDADAERLLYLGMVESLDQGLVRAIEAARDAVRRVRGTEANEWLRRRLGELGGETRQP